MLVEFCVRFCCLVFALLTPPLSHASFTPKSSSSADEQRNRNRWHGGRLATKLIEAKRVKQKAAERLENCDKYCERKKTKFKNDQSKFKKLKTCGDKPTKWNVFGNHWLWFGAKSYLKTSSNQCHIVNGTGRKSNRPAGLRGTHHNEGRKSFSNVRNVGVTLSCRSDMIRDCGTNE